MAKALKIILVLSMFAFSFNAPSTYAQNATDRAKISGPRKQLATIVFSGLAGAILGLSTLSFYGRPQDKLSNIAVGFAVGVIIGTGYTTYQAAVEPKNFYGYDRRLKFEEMNSISTTMVQPRGFTPQFGYSWSF